MSEFFAIDALSPAFDRTMKFFSGPNLLIKWLKFGFIVFVFMILSGQGSGSGGNFSSSDMNGFSNLFSSLIPTIGSEIILIVIVGAFLILLTIGIIALLLKNTAFFSILESLKSDDVRIIEYAMKNFLKGVYFSLLEIAAFILMLPLMIIVGVTAMAIIFAFINVFISLLGSSATLASTFTDPNLSGILTTLSDPIVLLVLVLLSIISIIIIMVVGYLLHQFVKYLMFIEGLGPIGALRKSVSLILGNLLEIIILMLIQVVFVIALTIVGFVIGLLLIIPLLIGFFIFVAVFAIAYSASPILGILVGIIGFILFLVLLYIVITIFSPLYAFFFNYNMVFLEMLLGKGKGIKGVNATNSVNARKRMSSPTA
ncbi:MAG: hypothetical protein ABID38_04655 [Candidatus Diapherotrites archaeon]